MCVRACVRARLMALYLRPTPASRCDSLDLNSKPFWRHPEFDARIGLARSGLYGLLYARATALVGLDEALAVFAPLRMSRLASSLVRSRSSRHPESPETCGHRMLGVYQGRKGVEEEAEDGQKEYLTHLHFRRLTKGWDSLSQKSEKTVQHTPGGVAPATGTNVQTDFMALAFFRKPFSPATDRNGSSRPNKG